MPKLEQLSPEDARTLRRAMRGAIAACCVLGFLLLMFVIVSAV